MLSTWRRQASGSPPAALRCDLAWHSLGPCVEARHTEPNMTAAITSRLPLRRLCQQVASGLVSGLIMAAAASADDLKLWYRQPAIQWVEALPIGNGRLGAMVFGGVTSERLQLN